MTYIVHPTPCPFCGGEPMLWQSKEARKLWRVVCKNCDAGPSSSFGETAALDRWNARAALGDAGWQDISTAPKDESSILVADARVKELIQVVFWYHTNTKFPWQTDDGIGYAEGRFTHWMPLPAPPVTRHERAAPGTRSAENGGAESKARASGWIAEAEYNGEVDGVRHPASGNWAEDWAGACAQMEGKT